MIRASSTDEAVLALLQSHPRVETAQFQNGLLEFALGPWQRNITRTHGVPPQGLYGLVEIVDNNPMVCADEFVLPSAGASLALIALAPVALADLMVDTPTILANIPIYEQEISAALTELGWSYGVTCHQEPLEGVEVAAMTVMVAIRTPEYLAEVREAYDERFSRSFYVRESVNDVWDPGLVFGRPEARYRLTLAPDSPHSLLTIRVLADHNGKVGATQVIHAMNVMCGFEESLGIS